MLKPVDGQAQAISGEKEERQVKNLTQIERPVRKSMNIKIIIQMIPWR
jgi:hypothetical protein